MVLKKENSIYIAINTWGVDDDRLITAIFGYLPDKETRKINDSESLLYSKTKVFNDNYYSIYDALKRLEKIDKDLDFNVTKYGDIIIYGTKSCSCTPQEVMESYNRYISSRFFIREEIKEDKKIGTILHEGEYILISHKITNETGYIGYTLLTHIGINTSKVNFLGSTRHFCTYAVIKDLELPFSTSEWQDFEVKNVRFHAYTKKLKNLILLEHDEFSLDYIDEIDDFFEKKEKEKKEMENKEMTIKENNYIYIASNTTGLSDSELIKALFGYVPTGLDYETICHSTPLFSRTKLLSQRSFDMFDARRRLRGLDGTLDFVMSSKGDILIYRDKDNDALRVFDAYEEYSMRRDMEKFNCVKSNSGRYPARLNTADGGYLAMCEPVFLTARGTGKSVMTMRHMLNSFYGLNGGLNNKKPPLKFKLIFGQEHATGRYKTICLWEDGEKTIIHGDNKVTKLPVAQAFAWCYVKRTFGTVSHFKKHVDKRTTKMDGVWYFEGDCVVDDYAQGSVPGTSKKRDIYDAAALAIVSKRYGGLRRLVDEYINKEDENGTR